MINNHVFGEVRAIVMDALGVNGAEVKLKTRLIDELDAESLDFLDIVFRLEHSFGIKIPRDEIERKARGGLSDGEFEVEGGKDAYSPTVDLDLHGSVRALSATAEVIWCREKRRSSWDA